MAAEQAKQKVLIIENDVELGRLLMVILDSEGFQAEWLCESPELVAQVRQYLPDVLVIDLCPGERCYIALDRLRTDPVTARVPVVVTTTLASTAASSLASYNVRAFFIQPFDLDDFLAAVRSALGRPPLHAQVPPPGEPDKLPARAELILAEHSREAIFRFAQRLRQQSPWRERQDLRLHELLDDVPVLVEAAAVALRYGTDAFFSQHPEAAERVRAHARLRRDQAFSLSSLIREYSILRDELLSVLWRHLPGQVASDEVEAVTRALNSTLDRIIEITVPAFTSEGEQEAAG